MDIIYFIDLILMDYALSFPVEEETFLEMLDSNIEKVIFNDPATVILWKTGEKTVVKAQDGEPYDKEKGFAMAILKYLNDNKSKYNNIIKKWCGNEVNHS